MVCEFQFPSTEAVTLAVSVTDRKLPARAANPDLEITDIRIGGNPARNMEMEVLCQVEVQINTDQKQNHLALVLMATAVDDEPAVDGDLCSHARELATIAFRRLPDAG